MSLKMEGVGYANECKIFNHFIGTDPFRMRNHETDGGK
jgi:hypothetical protein